MGGRGDPRRRGHAEQRLTGGRAGGAGPPAALARSEHAHGVEYNEAEAAVHAAVAMMARSCENATSMELHDGVHGSSVFAS
jgi:hypothetical protein